MILRVHLVPRLGSRRLDTITNEQVQQLKRALSAKAAKTVNNVLTVLNVLLKTAVEWAILKQMPCTIRLLPVLKTSATFHDFDDYEQLVDTARRSDWQIYLMACCWAVRRDYGAARCWRWNGRMWISPHDSSAYGDQIGKGTSPCRRVGDNAMCHSRFDWRRPFERIGT